MNLSLCFPYCNPGDCLQEASRYGGFRHWESQIESSSCDGTMLHNFKTHFQLPVDNPGMNNSKWELWVKSTLIDLLIADLHISCQLVQINIYSCQHSSTGKSNWERVSNYPFLAMVHQIYSQSPSPNHPTQLPQCVSCASLCWPLLETVPINIQLCEAHQVLTHTEVTKHSSLTSPFTLPRRFFLHHHHQANMCY